MNALGGLILVCGVVTFFVGAVAIMHPIQSLGFSRRLDGVLVVVLGLAIMFFGQELRPEPRQNVAGTTVASGATSIVASVPGPEKPISKSETLHKLRIGGVSWEKSGFGSVMIATFVIYNDNTFPIKDVAVTCTHAADSGTIIDSNTRTIYELIKARGYYSVVKLNMGFIHSAVNSSVCHAVNFSRV